MTLTINLPPSTLEKLRVEAAATGKAIDTLVLEAIDVKLAVAGRSFREIAAPIHEDFEKSGMSDGELDALIDETIAETRADRRAMRDVS